LTCAKKLNENGIDVEIFEKYKRNEETRPRQMEGTVHFLKNIPKCDYTYEMNKLVFTSKHERVEIKGKIGYSYEVGGKNGIETKLRKKVEKNVKINYGHEINDPMELRPDFDIIVAADGYRSKIAKNTKMRGPKPEYMGFGIGCTIKGDFDPHKFWGHFEDYYAEKGYTYIIAFDKKYATLASASIASKIEGIKIRKRLESLAKEKGYEIVDRLNDFETWFKFKTYQKDGVYLVGQAASLTESTFGFGIKWAIKSGELCAKSIINDLNYNEILKYELLPEFDFWRLIRKIIDSSIEDEYSSFVRSFANPIAKYYVRRGKYAPFIFKLAGWLKNIPVAESVQIKRKEILNEFSYSKYARLG